MWLGGDKIAHIKHFKLKIASTWSSCFYFKNKKNCRIEKVLCAIADQGLRDCVNRSDAIQSIRLREHTFARQKPICCKVINLAAMNLKDDWLPDDGFSGRVHARTRSGRKMPSLGTCSRKSFKQIFVTSPSLAVQMAGSRSDDEGKLVATPGLIDVCCVITENTAQPL